MNQSDGLAGEHLRADAALVDVGIPALTVLRSAVEPLFSAAGTTLDAEQARVDEGRASAAKVLTGSQVKVSADVTAPPLQ